MAALKYRKIAEMPVRGDEDIISVRQTVRFELQKQGVGLLEQTRLVAAVSELAKNIVVHAVEGTVLVFGASAGSRRGLKMVFEDEGPGIPDLDKAVREGFGALNPLGLGLKCAKRFVDEIDIESTVGKGTRVTITKWLPSA